MLRELRFAVRMLLKQPGFSLIAALTLALGIGATAAVFSLIQGVLLTTPPYEKPQQLLLIPTMRVDGQATWLGGATVDGVAERDDNLSRSRRVQLDLQFPDSQ